MTISNHGWTLKEIMQDNIDKLEARTLAKETKNA